MATKKQTEEESKGKELKRMILIQSLTGDILGIIEGKNIIDGMAALNASLSYLLYDGIKHGVNREKAIEETIRILNDNIDALFDSDTKKS